MSSRAVAQPGAASVEPVGARFDRNLAALAIGSPAVARDLAQAPSRTDIEFLLADDGLLSAVLVDSWGRRNALSSKRRPAEEADRLAARINLDEAAVIVVNGFAMGHHVRAILDRAKSSALLVVFEPDLGLLRAVLERQDHAEWLCDPLVRLVTDPSDTTALGKVLAGSEGLVSLGLEIVDHPPSTQRLGDASHAMAQNLAQVVRSIRTNVVTTLAQADVTIRNQLMNLDRYVASEGIESLRGACAGKPAIVVSAGPSLHRNLHLLKQPWVRERFVIVAVQTMLKPLLERGIRPHFVTALDYHEISKRFYEGLEASDVEGVTLVAEAKGNAAILDAWPGELRCPADGFLGQLLGEPAGARGAIKAGATVAHLAYYIARHLGCDPVILIGQDLGFTDGQYYAAGAAIHTVWGSELNEFCTLETLEWQRIKRMGSRLVTAADQLGRPVFTDEQMQTYRLQFERDFQSDTEQGLTVIDATEGGVAKAHTTVMALAEAMEPYRDGPALEIPETVDADRGGALRAALDRLRQVRADVWKIADISRESKSIIEEMIEHAGNQARVNELIARVYEHRDAVKAFDPAWELVQTINQRGTFRRARADREIHLADDSPTERQKAQMRRDASNLEGLAEAADELGQLMDQAVRAHEGRAAKITREDKSDRAAERQSKPKQTVWAAITADPGRSDLGIRRDLAAPIFEGKSALRLTLERLARVKPLAGIAIATAHRGDTAIAAGIDPAGGEIAGVRVRIIEVDDEPIIDRRRAIRGARAASPHCWRGGIAGWTYIDELVYPDALGEVLTETGADALLLCAPDWPAVDPAIGSAMIDRHAESPTQHRLVFSQAAVGLSPALLDRALLESIRDKRAESGAFASIGAVLGYVPIQPMSDPIAGTGCIAVEPGVRDLGERISADSRARRLACSALLKDLDGATDADAAAGAFGGCREAIGPEHLSLELFGIDGACMNEERAISMIRQAAEVRDDLVVTLGAARTANNMADALDHPGLSRIAHAAAGAGAIAVHVRTPVLADREAVLGLLDLGLDIISLEIVANDPHSYEMLTGRQGYETTRENLHALIEARNARTTADCIPLPWLVARITRRDAIYEEIDALYDRWLLACGAAVLDPLPCAIDGERIEPLPVPAPVADRLAQRTLTVRADLTTPAGDHLRDGVVAAWQRGVGAGATREAVTA